MKPEKRKSNTVIAICKRRDGKLMIAGDRRASWGFSMAQSMEFPKVNKKDNILLGATGHGDLCSLFVEDGGFKFPERKVKCLNAYMYHNVKPAVHRFLIGQKYGTKDTMSLPPDAYVAVVIGIDDQVWELCVSNPLEDGHHFAGDISLGRIPAIPYATGCGGLTTLSVMNYILKKKKHLTKQDLEEAVQMAIEMSPGCGGKCDVITQD